jgi:hypothetical protein
MSLQSLCNSEEAISVEMKDLEIVELKSGRSIALRVLVRGESDKVVLFVILRRERRT